MKRQSRKKQQLDISQGSGFWETVKTFVAVGVGSMIGVFGVYIVLGMFSLITLWLGSLLVKRNTVEDQITKKSKVNWNIGSVFGAFLIFLGLLPWVAFFFQGLMFNLGSNVADSLWQNFTS